MQPEVRWMLFVTRYEADPSRYPYHVVSAANSFADRAALHGGQTARQRAVLKLFYVQEYLS